LMQSEQTRVCRDDPAIASAEFSYSNLNYGILIREAAALLPLLLAVIFAFKPPAFVYSLKLLSKYPPSPKLSSLHNHTPNSLAPKIHHLLKFLADESLFLQSMTPIPYHQSLFPSRTSWSFTGA
jgi:hypothetical protein